MTSSSAGGRLIVGVDGDRASTAALEWVARRLADGDDRVVVVAVTEDAVPAAGLVEALETAHDDLRRRFGEERVEQRLIADADSIAGALVAEAGDDPIVVGHRRTRPMRTALAGWLSLDVVTRATGPVFVIPDDVAAGGRDIVVGVGRDGSARGAVGFALEEGARSGLPIRLVRAEDTPGSALALETLVAELRSVTPVPVSASTANGRPEDVLDRVAEDSSLIVIGRHEGSPLEEVLAGATDHELMLATSVPLCVVPPPE